MRKLLAVLTMLILMFAFGCKKEQTTDASKASAKEAKEIVIGVQGPETGEIAVYGLQTLYGAQLAAKEINEAGGINGKHIKLVHYDSKGDKVEAVSVAQRLINNDKVCAIIGEPTSGALLAIRNVANNKQTIAISAGATAPDVTKGTPYIFRNTLLDSDGVPETIRFLKESKGWTKYAIITSTNNDYSVGLSKTFKDAVISNGCTIVVEQSIHDKDTNIAPQITAMKSKKFDAVIFTGYYQEASLILLELRKQGMNAPLVGGDGFQSAELYKVGKDASVGTVFFSGLFIDSEQTHIKEFKRKITEMGVSADMFAAQGYDAMYLLANAAKEANVTNCADASQRSEMRDVLAKTKDFNGVSGKMSFDEIGNAVKKPFIQEVAKDKDGTFKFILINE